MSNTPIKLIVGLGNPGEQYTKTRHNAGFFFIDALCLQITGTGSKPVLKADKNCFGKTQKVIIAGREVRILQPDTFMNESGKSVLATLQYYKIDVSEMLIVHDELDLDPGIARLKLSGGHGGNNGIRNIAQRLATNEFARLRIGIGHPGVGRDVSAYVLKQANKDDQKKIDTAIAESLRVLDLIVEGDFARAMNELHTSLA